MHIYMHDSTLMWHNASCSELLKPTALCTQSDKYRLVVVQVWLQEFAWMEEEKADKIERRNRDGPTGRKLAKEPMFCFEFAMNMLYWSALVYDYGEVRMRGSV